MEKLQKVVLLGETMVGKTAIAKRLYDDSYVNFSTPTVALGNMVIERRIEDILVRFNLFDTAGQEKYKSLSPIYFQNADLIILVYDTTAEETFDALESWRKMVEQCGPDNVSFLVVGNKCDKKEAEVLVNEKTRNYATSIGAQLFITSAKTGEGIETLLKGISDSLNKASTDQDTVNLDGQANARKGCC